MGHRFAGLLRTVGFVVVLAVVSIGCTRASVSASTSPDASANVAQAGEAEVAWVLTDDKLSAWLRWHALLRAADAGVDARARALLERATLADAGLRASDVDRIEDLVSAVVAERTVERLTGTAAMEQFKKALAELSPEQRAKAEATFAETSAKAAPHASAQSVLEARFGEGPVKLVLSREAEVTKTWDALLEGRGDQK